MKYLRRILIAALFPSTATGCLNYASELRIDRTASQTSRITAENTAAVVAKVSAAFSLKPDPRAHSRYRWTQDAAESSVVTIASFVGTVGQTPERHILVLVNKKKADGAPSVFIKSWDSPRESPDIDRLADAIKNAIEAEAGLGAVQIETAPGTPGYFPW